MSAENKSWVYDTILVVCESKEVVRHNKKEKAIKLVKLCDKRHGSPTKHQFYSFLDSQLRSLILFYSL